MRQDGNNMWERTRLSRDYETTVRTCGPFFYIQHGEDFIVLNDDEARNLTSYIMDELQAREMADQEEAEYEAYRTAAEQQDAHDRS